MHPMRVDESWEHSPKQYKREQVAPRVADEGSAAARDQGRTTTFQWTPERGW